MSSRRSLGSINEKSFMPAPRAREFVGLNVPSLGDQLGHKYEYQSKVDVSEGRFAYDGALPAINSKYKRQSMDIAIEK